MDIVNWAHENVVAYSIILIAITVLICWYLFHKPHAEHGVNAGMAGRTTAAVQTAVLMDKVHGADGLTVVDKEFEKMMLDSQLDGQL